MLKLKLQYFGYLTWRAASLEQTLILGKIEGGTRMGRQRTVGWHHWLNGHEFGWTPGVGDGQGGLACCSSWGRKESDTNWTELNSELNWTELTALRWVVLLVVLSGVIHANAIIWRISSAGSPKWIYSHVWASLVAQMVKSLPAMQETRDLSLGWEDPLEKGMATHSSILVWRIPWIEETGGL